MSGNCVYMLRMMWIECLDKTPGLFGCLDILKQIEILRIDGAFFHQCLEIDDALPIRSAKQQDRYRLDFLCLDQGQSFE